MIRRARDTGDGENERNDTGGVLDVQGRARGHGKITGGGQGSHGGGVDEGDLGQVEDSPGRAADDGPGERRGDQVAVVTVELTTCVGPDHIRAAGGVDAQEAGRLGG
jgi:hypothetical protein